MLPYGQNMPQKMKYDLYTEGVSATFSRCECSLTGRRRLTEPHLSRLGGITNLRKYARSLMITPILTSFLPYTDGFTASALRSRTKASLLYLTTRT